ncbi:nuclear transport factor 2 family protein [Streptomyces sp. ME19-01-6]|uniref:nuclear transport factor 2 family protein n=1 Tax=Streptomyces sp. ME19-01-6 TaxID=3028686 RepID=UPI0029BE7812|nr:nuclear transport factor 2 family protein [Streptomyces sp. ME19-01-6]MDX3232131.1 nuclear transport factor 2 family protein [Streptomyces sp. ME19-01-6]
MANVDVVRACMESYLAQDRDTAERLIAEEFVFTSPQDDHIDKAAFFERCFPTVDRLRYQKILEAVPTGGDDVFLLYEYELKTGGRYRNVELITVRDGRITEIQVFFGGRVPASVERWRCEPPAESGRPGPGSGG